MRYNMSLHKFAPCIKLVPNEFIRTNDGKDSIKLYETVSSIFSI